MERRGRCTIKVNKPMGRVGDGGGKAFPLLEATVSPCRGKATLPLPWPGLFLAVALAQRELYFHSPYDLAIAYVTGHPSISNPVSISFSSRQPTRYSHSSQVALRTRVSLEKKIKFLLNSASRN